jgi:hypothetical protein
MISKDNQSATIFILDLQHAVLTNKQHGTRFRVDFPVDLQTSNVIFDDTSPQVTMSYYTIAICGSPYASAVISLCDCAISEVDNLVSIL